MVPAMARAIAAFAAVPTSTPSHEAAPTCVARDRLGVARSSPVKAPTKGPKTIPTIPKKIPATDPMNAPMIAGLLAPARFAPRADAARSTPTEMRVRAPSRQSEGKPISWKSPDQPRRRAPTKISGQPGRAGMIVPAIPIKTRRPERSQSAIEA